MFAKENIDILKNLKTDLMDDIGIIPRVAQDIFKKIRMIE
jgi:hypothetical protein